MKKWTCICGSNKFQVTKVENITVDFSSEGAIEGHPFITRSGMGAQVITCAQCHMKLATDVVTEMLMEII